MQPMIHPSLSPPQHVTVPRAEDQKRLAPPPSTAPRPKPRPVDPFFPELFEEDESVPPLAMVATCLTQDPSAVEAAMSATVRTFSEVLALDEDTMGHLLMRCHWRKMPLLDAYSIDYSNLLYETGLAPLGSTAPAAPFPRMDPAKKSTCKICLQIRRNTDFFSLWCGHFCCYECWAQQIKNRLGVNNVRGVHCIQYQCKAAPTTGWLVEVFGDESKTVKTVG